MTFLFLPVYTLCQQYTENRGWSRRNGIPHQMSGFWDNAGHRQIIYPDGQSVSSYWRVEPFAVLFWALATLFLQTPDPARRPGITQPRDSTGVENKVKFDRRSVAPLPFPIYCSCTYYLSMMQVDSIEPMYSYITRSNSPKVFLGSQQT